MMNLTTKEVGTLLDNYKMEALREVVDNIIKEVPTLIPTLVPRLGERLANDVGSDDKVEKIRYGISTTFSSVTNLAAILRKLYPIEQQIDQLPRSKAVEKLDLSMFLIENYLKLQSDYPIIQREIRLIVKELMDRLTISPLGALDANSDSVQQIIERISSIVKQMPEELEWEAVSSLYRECRGIIFNEGHYRQLKSALLFGEQAALARSRSSEKKEQLGLGGESYDGTAHLISHYQDILDKLISEWGNDNERLAFWKDHSDNQTFRKKLVLYYLNQKDFDEALEWSLDDESNREYTPIGLLEYAYDIYGIKGETDLQKEVAQTIILRGNNDFIKKLKDLCTEEEWREVIQELYLASEKYVNVMHWQGTYVSLISFEQDIPRMLRLCRRYPEIVAHLSDTLLPTYSEEVLELLEVAIGEVFLSLENPLHSLRLPQYINLMRDYYGSEYLQRLFYRIRAVNVDDPTKLKEIDLYGKAYRIVTN